MFNKKQLIRNFIFAAFCVLILMVSFMLTYYITFYPEEQVDNDNDNFKTVGPQQNKECESSSSSSIGRFIQSGILKLLAAFFAGGMLSDGIFFKLGVI
jgi:hypothetical protein